MEDVRAFIAVELSEGVRSAIANLVARLRPDAPGIRWVGTDNVHITVKFLGDVPPSAADKIGEALGPKLHRVEPFEARICGLGCFPSPARPRIVWVGVAEGAERLVRMQQKVDAAMGSLGFAREGRPFRPHLTVGRLRRDARPVDMRPLVAREGDTDFGSISVSEVVLFRSDLRPEGARYTPIDRYALGRVASAASAYKT